MPSVQRSRSHTDHCKNLVNAVAVETTKGFQINFRQIFYTVAKHKLTKFEGHVFKGQGHRRHFPNIASSSNERSS